MTGKDLDEMGIPSDLYGKTGREFEKEIGKSFDAYLKSNIAILDFMPPRVKVIGQKNGIPIYARVGKSPYDIFGFSIQTGLVIAAELKSSSKATHLPVVQTSKRGSGIQEHQLHSLAEIAKCGGIARIVWRNGGEIGILRNSGIITAYTNFLHCISLLESGERTVRTMKSIPWNQFSHVDYRNICGVICIDWLQ